MKIDRRFLAVAWFVILAFTVSAWANNEVELNRKVKKVAHELVCLCGCGNQVLDVCTCAVAAKERKRIKNYLQSGKTQQEILDIFIAEKGWVVLSAPPKKGFNQILWIFIPYILPIVSVFILFYFLKKWKKKQDKELEEDWEEEDADYNDQLEKELDKFED
ncbi:MAG: cytochrome c-type biogenesis protein CcmH [bacterium]